MSTRKSTIKNFISNFLVWPILFFIVLLFENNKGFTVSNMTGLNWVDVALVSGFIILLFIIYAYRGIFTQDGFVHTILPYMLIILFMGNVISSLANLFQDTTVIRLIGNVETPFVLDIDLKEFIYSNLFSLIGVILAMLFLSIIPRRMTHPGQMNLLFYVLFIFLFISIVFSLITEWQLYVDALTRGIRDYVYVTKSFFLNRNLFASYLLLGMMVAIYLYAISRKYRFLILTIPFAFAIVFTISKTKVLLAYILLMIVFFTVLVRLFKSRWWKGIGFTFLWASFIVAPILLLTIPTLRNTYPGQLMSFFVEEVLIDQGERTMVSRIAIWKETLRPFFTSNVLLDFKHLDYFKLFFGEGNFLSRIVLGFRMPSSAPTDHYLGNFHNGFVAVFASGGLVALIPYLGLIFYLYFVNFRIHKKNRSLGFFGLLSLTFFLVHSMVESITLISFNSEGIAHSIPVVLPIMSYYYYAYKQPELLKEQVRHGGYVKNFIDHETLMKPSKKAAFFIIPIASTLLLGMFDLFTPAGVDIYFYVTFAALVLLIAFTLPYMYQSIVKHIKKKRHWILPLSSIILVPTLGGVISILLVDKVIYGVFLGYVLLVIMYMVLKKVFLDKYFDFIDHLDAFRDTFVAFDAVTLVSLLIQIPVVILLSPVSGMMLGIKIADILLFNFIILYQFGLSKKEKGQIALFLHPLNERMKRTYRKNIIKYEAIEAKENRQKKKTA